MQAKSYIDYAKKVSAYISDPSTVRIRTLEQYGRAPSVSLIKGWQDKVKADKQKEIEKRKKADSQYVNVEFYNPQPIPELRVRKVSKWVDPKDIIKAIAEYHGTTYHNIIGLCRLRKTAHVRFLIARILKERGNSYHHIGHLLGGRDHSTISHGIWRFPDVAKRHPEILKSYEHFRKIYVLSD